MHMGWHTINCMHKIIFSLLFYHNIFPIIIYLLISGYNELYYLPSILATTNIMQQIFLFDSLAQKHAYAQIVFTAITICLNEK